MRIPYWPPGPNERKHWETILTERPDLAPAVGYPGNIRSGSGEGCSEPRENQINANECGSQQENDGGNAKGKETAEPQIRRVVDGASDWLVECQEDRNERLQCLGNGVVPLTGAIAFRVLWERMVEGK